MLLKECLHPQYNLHLTPIQINICLLKQPNKISCSDSKQGHPILLFIKIIGVTNITQAISALSSIYLPLLRFIPWVLGLVLTICMNFGKAVCNLRSTLSMKFSKDIWVVTSSKGVKRLISEDLPSALTAVNWVVIANNQFLH